MTEDERRWRVWGLTILGLVALIILLGIFGDLSAEKPRRVQPPVPSSVAELTPTSSHTGLVVVNEEG